MSKQSSYFQKLIFCILLTNQVILATGDIEVVMISELYRHGARTTLKSILPESCTKTGVCELGKLTPNGMRQQILLGRQTAGITYP